MAIPRPTYHQFEQRGGSPSPKLTGPKVLVGATPDDHDKRPQKWRSILKNATSHEDHGVNGHRPTRTILKGEVSSLKGKSMTQFHNRNPQNRTAARAAKCTVTITASTEREVFLNNVVDGLAANGHLFARGRDIFTDRGGSIELVRSANMLARTAGRQLNIVRVDASGNSKYIDLTPGEGKFILESGELRSRLPQLRSITRVPVLNDEFAFVSPGYNPSSSIYYDGELIRPTQGNEHLNNLLRRCPFRRPVDRSNFLGFLLTQFLGPHFAGGRPICTITGNQQEIGKTQAAQVIALIQGAQNDFQCITYQPHDLELEKCVGAAVQRSNCIVIDNAKPTNGRNISSPAIERTITAPRFNFRRIGTSDSIEGENFLQFIITWNGGELSSDLSTRSVFVQLAYEGDPSQRQLPVGGDLLDYAREYHCEIVANLMGMIERWQEKRCPFIPVACRFKQWAEMINGILVANGITDFLATYSEDCRHVDANLLALTELAAARPSQYLHAKEWVAVASPLGVLRHELKGITLRAQQTKMGTLLKSRVGREFTVSGDDEISTARYKLLSRLDRNGTLYAFMPVDAKAEDATQLPTLG